MEGGCEQVDPAVDCVIGEQLERLKLFIETGLPKAEPGGS